MNFADAERESFKMRIQELQIQLDQPKDEKRYIEVYQRRENLRVFGIQEVGAEEDTREVLVDFLRRELSLEDADGLEISKSTPHWKVGPLRRKTQTNYCTFPEIP